MAIDLNLVLPKFEGPLDLLLHLLEKNEVDIYDIPINLITEQFIEYIEYNQQNNIEVTSEFIVMAAHLLEIKSRMLLPIHGEELVDFAGDYTQDPRFELVQRLNEYRIFRDAAITINQQYQEFKGRAFKEASLAKDFKTDNNDEELYRDMDIDILVKALNKVIMRIPESDQNRKEFFSKLNRDQYTIEAKLNYLNLSFEEKSVYKFRELIHRKMPKIEVIITFLALLELLKTGQYKIKQEQNFDDIIIERVTDE